MRAVWQAEIAHPAAECLMGVAGLFQTIFRFNVASKRYSRRFGDCVDRSIRLQGAVIQQSPCLAAEIASTLSPDD
jgi:hypothetical protein